MSAAKASARTASMSPRPNASYARRIVFASLLADIVIPLFAARQANQCSWSKHWWASVTRLFHHRPMPESHDFCQFSSLRTAWDAIDMLSGQVVWEVRAKVSKVGTVIVYVTRGDQSWMPHDVGRWRHDVTHTVTS